MPQSVEVLVPDDASAAKVEQEVGRIASVQLRTKPSAAVARRVAVAPMAALESAGSREHVWSWLADIVLHVGAAPVFLSFGSGKSYTYPFMAALVHHIATMSARTKVEPFLAPDAQTVRRMILARKASAEDRLIASASVENGKLIVWSCEPKRYEVAVSEIPVLATSSRKGLAKLQVSESGSRIHWDEGDVDLDLEAIRELADPKVRKASETKLRHEAARMGDAMRRLRESRGLRQADIPGLSERQVRRLEAGGMIPHSDSLKKIAAAHGMSPNDYLAELAKMSRSRKKVRNRSEAGA